MNAAHPTAPVDLAAAIRVKSPGGRLRWYLLSVVAVLVIASVIALVWNRYSKQLDPASLYVTHALTRGDISLVITATGNLAPTTEVTVGSELSGTTLEVYVDFNDRVTKGMPLAKLDTSRLAQQTASSRAAVRSSQARVAQAEATVKEAVAALGRQQELYQGSLVSTATLEAAVATAERARADVQSAQASVGEAEAQVRINENDLTKAIIKSPIDGIVLTRSIEPGQTVAASFTAPQLFIIAETLERMKLEVSIAEADIGRVSRGQKSTFTVDAWPERTYSAVVSIVSYGSAVKDNVVTYEADLDVNNVDLSLRPGMTATADILVAASTNVFLIPTAALRFEPAPAGAVTPVAVKKSFVQSLIPMPTRNSKRPAATDDAAKSSAAHIWVFREGRLESIPVLLGLNDGRNTEISGVGLTEGMKVVLRANIPSA